MNKIDEYFNGNANFNTLKYKKFKHIIEENEKKSHLITYKFLLPFRLPIPNGSSFASKNNKYIFQFLHKEYKHPAAQDIAVSYPIRVTIVEATLKISKKSFGKYCKLRETKKNLFLTDQFQKLLDILNKFIIGVSVWSKNDSIYSVTPSDFIGEIMAVLYTFLNDKIQEIESYILQKLFRLKYINDSKQIVEYDEYKQSVLNLIDLDEGNYFKTFNKSRESERLYRTEKYDDCIVSYNTAMEMYITNFVLRYERLVLKCNEKRLKNLSEKTSYANLLNNHFLKIIDKDLDFNNKKILTVMLNYFINTVAQYRHDIVHNGKTFTLLEADETMQFYSDITSLITHDMHTTISNEFTDEFKKYYYVTSQERINEIIKEYTKKYLV